MVSEKLRKLQSERRRDFDSLSDLIWENPELRYREFRSSSLQKEFLIREGFSVTSPIAGIETAFMAEKGNGGPVIAFCGEFDALPGLSQKADVNTPDPVVEGGPGHGCGHNLLGAGCIEAAVLTASLLEENAIDGRVRYYGCPAEESGAGKAFMVRAGVFDGVDIALAWHPSAMSAVMNNSLANVRVIYEFFGKAAHAASHPHEGRSALDALELCNVGANFLREHIIQEARIHYAILDSGGNAPNVVQPYAKEIYALRAPRITQVGEILERMNDVARGAALMTGTKVKISIVSAYANLMPNDTLDSLMLSNANEIWPLEYTQEEKAYAKRFLRKDEEESVDSSFLQTTKMPPMASTDFGDVSWVVPSSALAGCCYAKGTVLHSWSVTAQGKSEVAHRGMHASALALSATALDLFSDTALIEKAKRDHAKTLGGESYRSLIPDDVEPGSF